MRLYGTPESSSTYRVRIALNLKGLAVEQVTVNLRRGEHRTLTYLERNPQGLVPLLEDGEVRVAQSLAIMEYLERRYLPGLSKHIVSEHRIDPLHFEGTLNSYLGSAFSVEPTLTQSAWMRPHNVSEDVPNLYFAGAGTHPGAGIPGVLSSGKIVAEMIGSGE